LRDLSSLQQAFQDFILQKDKDENIGAEMISTANATVSKRLAIYQDAYFTRLLDSLKQDYPVLLALIGDDDFEKLGHAYIQANPSSHRSIRWFGETFSQFIAARKQKPHLSWQIEMANFEWSIMLSFDAEDAPIFPLEKMAEVPYEDWSRLRFTLHPSMQHLNLVWNTVALWNAWKEKNERIIFSRAEAPVNWIIWRKGFEIHFCSLSKEESYVISAMKAGVNFGSICEGLCQWVGPDEVATFAAMLLKRFIVDHMLAHVSIE
jgi:hypothetical protein